MLEYRLTQKMIDSAMQVDWVKDYQGEFCGYEAEDDVRMRRLIEILWNRIIAAAN